MHLTCSMVDLESYYQKLKTNVTDNQRKYEENLQSFGEENWNVKDVCIIIL